MPLSAPSVRIESLHARPPPTVVLANRLKSDNIAPCRGRGRGRPRAEILPISYGTDACCWQTQPEKRYKMCILASRQQAGTLSTVGKLVLPSRCSVSVVIGIIIVVVVVAESIL